ncbi:sensor histidine kinase [Brevibacterium marinum]|uniref:histidine kinase n=1 Tax=Brevibacterium marinum TaxID=418643 RepID=A0A846RWJ5_9MICO|nr:histidine kinase [Brevibacterium marinum]NJC56336.1 signal transduction histidine kinase [Brevibacterium marinum]
MNDRLSAARGRQASPPAGPGSRLDRVRALLAAHPWVSDALIWVLPLAYIAVAAIVANAETPSFTALPTFLQVAIVLLQTVPLALRRTAPLFSSMLIAFACLLSILTMLGPTVGIIAVPLTIYSTTAWGTRRHGHIVFGLGLGGALLLGLWFYLVSLQSTLGPNARSLEFGEYLLMITVVALCASIVLAAWMLGGVGYRRRREIEGIRERNRLLEHERESETRLATDAERMRIAREMHDVIAHSLSVVIAQADGGRYAASANPQAAVGALETISRTGRDALEQTRSLLGFLRADDDDSRRAAPLPGVADIRRLIDDIRSAGLPVSIAGIDEVDDSSLPDGAGLAVYRIVQEALTNVLKHAGSIARAHVSLHTETREFVARISDDGAGQTPDAETSDSEQLRSRGNGITGMKERAALYGGTLTARPIRSTGLPDANRPRAGHEVGLSSDSVTGSAFGTATGFVVEARFPLRGGGDSATAPSATVRPETAHSETAHSDAAHSEITRADSESSHGAAR